MDTNATLAANLALLTEALDQPGVDVAETLNDLASDVRLAVRSYLGLTVVQGDATPAFAFTAMDDLAIDAAVLSSLMLAVSRADGGGPPLAVILYAGRAGAFVDLAADLSWLTGVELADFALDEHLTVHSAADGAQVVQIASAVNQAIGVLIGRGLSPDQATLELDARATAASHSRYDAAIVILSRLPRDNSL